MSWTAPRTWVAGEIVTAAELNTHVRDNLNYLYPAMTGGCIKQASAAQTIPNGGTIIDYDTIAFQNGVVCDTTNNRLVIAEAGVYRIRAAVHWADGGATGATIMTGTLIRHNGGTVGTGAYVLNNGSASFSGIVVFDEVYRTCSVNDTFQVYANQNTGGNKTTFASDDNFLMAERVA